jgi:hypothetical protein
MMLVVFLTVVLLQNQTVNGRFKKKEINLNTSNKKTLLHMKKIILTLSLVALISTSLVSCSTDDSALENNTAAPAAIDGDIQLPKPPMRA